MRNYRDVLSEAFSTRKARNSGYSLRAFARDLGISPTALSQALSSKRDLSKKNVLKVADRLALSPLQTQKILDEVRGIESSDSFDPKEYHLVQEAIFKLMSDWYYMAILNLAKLPTNQANPSWVAKRLRISVIEARNAIDRLERLGFLEIAGNRLKRTVQPLTTTHGVPSSALRAYHKQNLKLAETSIDRDAIGLREFASLTMALDSSELEAAKKEIARFKKRFSKLFKSKKATEVYTLAIQLFPLTVLGETK